MSKVITFFRNRQQETGQTYEFRVEGPSQIYRFFVFSWKPLEEKLVQNRNLSKEGGGSVLPEVDRIKSAILRGQGGAIAVIYEENRNRYLWTISVVPQPEAAFSNIGILLPGHPSLHLEASTDSKGISFPPGAHALIPVDKEAEESLRGFQDYLRYLPSDLESLVLHAIRDPSLDTRVSLLEAVVRKDIAEPSASKNWLLRLFPFLAKVPWLGRSLPIWPLVAILCGLMLAVNSLLLYSILQSDNGSVVVPFISRQEEPPPPPASTKPSQKIFELIEVVRKSPNPGLSALFQGHFSNVQNESDVTKILASGNAGALLARGLMKLEAFRQNQKDGAPLFSPADNPSAVNNFYEKRNLDAKPRDMLAALACAAFNSPELPKAPSAAAVPFADVSQGCKGFPLEKAVPGLDDLLKRVQEIK